MNTYTTFERQIRRKLLNILSGQKMFQTNHVQLYKMHVLCWPHFLQILTILEKIKNTGSQFLINAWIF